MSFQLTPGAVAAMNSGSGTTDNGLTPTLQLLSTKKMGTGGKTRYRGILSDGAQYCSSLLATQMHPMIETGEVKGNTVLKIHKFLLNTNKATGKNIIIVLNASIVGQHHGRIGEPKSMEGGAATAAAAPSPAPSQAPTSNPYPGRDNSAVASAPIVHRGQQALANGTPITMIGQLNMYQNRWTIKARVTNKSDVRTWSNSRGEGSLFSIELLDASGMDIRATIFKEGVDKFYNFIQENKVYTVSGGRLKVANAQYNTCKSSMEITLDQNSEIHLVEDDGGIGAQSYDLTRIADIEAVEAGKTVDLMGVVIQIGDVQSLTSKKTGQELKKCDITLVDDSAAQIRLTLWGKQAETADTTIAMHKILAVRKARVSDYGGKSLSGGNGLSVDPDIPEAAVLHRWWATQGSNGAQVKSLSSAGGLGGRMDPFNERKTVSSIKQENLGTHSEKGDYFSFKAHISFLKKDKEGGAWYTACPNKDAPCNNRCKVNQTTDGNWQCDRCQGTFPDCTRKWIFSGTVADDTGSTWVSFFDEQASQLFGGVSADEAFSKQEEQDYYDGLFAMATSKEFVFKCRAKTEVYNDESRVKTQVVRMDPVDYASESRDILAALSKYITA